jgi:hypothetical protein
MITEAGVQDYVGLQAELQHVAVAGDRIVP